MKRLKKSVIKAFEKRDHKHQQCIDRALSYAESKCAAQGLRLTRQRRQVLELVWSSHEPMKAYDLLEKLSEGKRRAAPPTVYRALDFLLEHGLIHRIESLNAYVGCGGPEDNHAGQFLICKHCGEVAELDDKELSEILSLKAKKVGFHMTREIIEIQGLCAECRRHESHPVR